jgi:zinc transport system permease protein
MDIASFLQYAFVQRAFVAGLFVAALCAVLGLFLVLRKMSLIGDGLSHVSFGAIALGLFLGVYPLYVAVPVAILGSLLILFIAKKANIFGDASIGIVSAVGISGGVILASLSHGFNVDLFSYLFGNILAISQTEVYISIGLSAFVFGIIYFFYNDLFAATFDEEYAKVAGIKTDRLNAVIAALTAVSVVLSVRVVGVMLISALLILPAVTALQLASGFKSALWISVLVSAISVIVGIIVSFAFDLPSGATIVMVGFAFFVLSLLKKLFWKK